MRASGRVRGVWWVVAVAWSQEEVCAPVAPAALEGHVAGAEAALAAGQVDDARPAASAAHEAARCLSVPVPPPLLGRYAWIEATLAAHELDDGRAWEWIRLARLAGSAAPSSAPPSLREVLETEGPMPASGGPTGVVLAVPPKGTAYADGAPLTEPRLLLSTPHLVQVFDRDGARVSGAWQMGGSFPAWVLAFEGVEIARQRREDVRTEVPPEGWKPRKEGTEAAYRDWIEKHPNGPFLEDARDAIDDLHWAAAVQAGTDLAARQYLHDHPEGLHTADARFVVEDRAYRRVMANPSKAAWERFLAEVPVGTYANEARVQLDALAWKEARTRDTAAAYRAYLDAWPRGFQAERASALEVERAFDLARARGDDALHAFLQKWSGSVWEDEARALIGEVRIEAVTLAIEPSADPSVAAALDAGLRRELETRAVPLATAPGPGVARLRVVPAPGLQRGAVLVRATVALEWAGLDRPLFEQVVEAPILPTDDPAPALAETIVKNLLPFDRWRPAPQPAAPTLAPAPK